MSEFIFKALASDTNALHNIFINAFALEVSSMTIESKSERRKRPEESLSLSVRDRACSRSNRPPA